MKRNKNFITILGLAILLSLIIFSCEQEEEPTVEGKVKFSINLNSLKKGVSLKSLFDVRRAIITIETSDGQSTSYTSSEMDVQNMNGILYTQKITLLSGNYMLTEFLLLDASGSTIYAAPLEGSELAVHVLDPLPIDFTVVEDEVTPVPVEVLSTEGSTPDQFGMVSFSIVEVSTFEFQIGVVDAATNEVIKATLNLSCGGYGFVKELDSILNNVVLVRDDFSTYSLSISKQYYTTVTQFISVDSLKMYGDSTNVPLIIELVPQTTDPVIDIDGNSYQTVRIGNQIWMAENLKTSKLNDGTEIPIKIDDAHWESPGPQRYAYCWYNNDSATYANPYGALYNWHAIKTSDLCPDGWHIPARDEFDTLVTYLGGSSQAVIKLKETGTAHWQSPNNGTNVSGFTAVPAGNRHDEEGFYNIGASTVFWTSTPDPLDPYWSYAFYLGNATSSTDQVGKGFSVRCIKDD